MSLVTQKEGLGQSSAAAAAAPSAEVAGRQLRTWVPKRSEAWLANMMALFSQDVAF